MSTNTITSIPFDRVEFFKSHFENGIVFFDLETTGLSPLCDKIIEFGAIKITQDGVQSINFLIDPKVSITPENQKFTGSPTKCLNEVLVILKQGKKSVSFCQTTQLLLTILYLILDSF